MARQGICICEARVQLQRPLKELECVLMLLHHKTTLSTGCPAANPPGSVLSITKMLVALFATPMSPTEARKQKQVIHAGHAWWIYLLEGKSVRLKGKKLSGVRTVVHKRADNPAKGEITGQTCLLFPQERAAVPFEGSNRRQTYLSKGRNSRADIPYEGKH